MKQLCFIHLPKTAGTSFRVWAGQAFAKSMFWHALPGTGAIEDQDSPEGIKRLASVRVIGGHLSIDNGVLRKVPTEKIVCSVLRDPVERAISYYHFCQKNPNHVSYPEVSGRTLYECLVLRKKFFKAVRNVQFRNLIGTQDFHRLCYAYIIGRFEAMDRFVAAVAAEFHVPLPELLRHNVGDTGYAEAVRSQVDFDRAESFIRANSRWDYDLLNCVDGVLRIEAGGGLPEMARLGTNAEDSSGCTT